MECNTQALVLAAGKSTRFSTHLTKLSAPLCGQEMIVYPLKLLKDLSIKTTAVVGYQKELVTTIIKNHNLDVECIEQPTPRGTGHAVLSTRDSWFADTLLILNGDAPLIKPEHIQALMRNHTEKKATISFIAAHNADPSITGYGRVITGNGRIAIIEQREFTGDPEKECRLNAGIYLINRSFLEQTLSSLEPHAQGELYITDLIKKASDQGERIEVIDIPFDFARGINTLKELWVAEHIIKSDLILTMMNKGVRFAAPQSVQIDLDVTIGSDSFIGYGVHLRKGTRIGNNVMIDAFSVLDNAHIHNDVLVHPHSVISNAEIKSGCTVGPFAHIHRNSTLQPQSMVGNFVEVSKSSLGKKSKAKHLAYLGQAQIGEQVTIGAGTITCNYNGVTKNTTTIKDNAFIGSNAALVAPVTVSEGAIVAAGSVITQDVPAQALAIAREKQVNKENYAGRLQEKYRASRPLPQNPKKFTQSEAK